MAAATCVWESGGAELAQSVFCRASVSTSHNDTSLLPWTDETIPDWADGLTSRRRTHDTACNDQHVVIHWNFNVRILYKSYCTAAYLEHSTGGQYLCRDTDGAETAAIDRLVSSWSENIFVSFCLWAPRYGLTLWCDLGLLVGGATQVPQLQLQLQSNGHPSARYLSHFSFSNHFPAIINFFHWTSK